MHETEESKHGGEILLPVLPVLPDSSDEGEMT